MYSKVKLLLGLAGGALVLISCRNATAPEVRHFTEIRTQAPVPAQPASLPGMNMNAARRQMIARSARTGLHLSWKTPAGWKEEAGQGIRIVSFTIVSAGHRGRCSIVTLAGMAGGLGANIERWRGQLRLPPLDQTALTSFIQKQKTFSTKAGWKGTLINFLPVPPDGAGSMLAADIRAPGAAVFIKLTGPKELLKKEYRHFQNLCESIRSR